MFLLGNVWLVLLKTSFMFLRTKKKKKKPNLFLFSPVLVFQNKNQFLNKFHVFVKGCLVNVNENMLHVFKKKKNQTCSCSPLFLFFQNKNQFLTGFMFLLGNVWLVLLKTGFMFLRTKKKKIREPNLLLFSHVLGFSGQKPIFK